MDPSAVLKSCPALQPVLKQDPSLQVVFDRLLDAGLAGVFEKFLHDAPAAAVRTFLKDASHLDLDRVARHCELLDRAEERPLSPDDVEPVPLVTLEEQMDHRTADEKAGLDSLARGEWASVAFAGGAGTRFFSSLDELEQALSRPNEALRKIRFGAGEPKGVFPISPVGGLSFYEITLAGALHCGVRTARMPWVLFLTSSVTHQQTVDYLSDRDLWGFPRGNWIAFMQASEPRLDADQDLIVCDDKGHMSWTGDGHGGVYRALLAAQHAPDGHETLLEFLRHQGVHHLVMYNVDNPAARPFGPARLGFHLRQGALFTLSAVRKTDPREKVGLLMRIIRSGKVEVVEYNVLDEALALVRDPGTGRLLHEAGNTNTHLIDLEAVRPDIEPTIYTGKMVASRAGLVAGSSMEMLSQHITRLLDPDRVLAFEVARPDFFMPTKNVTGVDSVESTTRALSGEMARQLCEAGAQVDAEALCDLHPACGAAEGELGGRGIGPGWKIGAGARLYLSARMGDPSGGPVCEGAVHLEPGSTLVLEAQRPYGRIDVDSARAVVVDPREASCVRIGQDVVVRAGVRVALHVGPGARLNIPSGRCIQEDIEGEVPAGTQRTL